LTTEPYDRGGWRRSAVTVPEEVTVGQEVDAVVAFTNTAGSPQALRVEAEALHGWTLLQQMPAATVSAMVAPGESVQYTLRLRAGAPTLLDADQRAAARMSVGGLDGRGGWPVMIRVRYPQEAEGVVACGERWFPVARRGSDTVRGSGYLESACCGGVFYPAAQCCDSSACTGGARCLDGRCVVPFPGAPWALTPLTGPQRVLVVLVDGPPVSATEPCRDHSAALRETLDLDGIESWFRAVSEARVGRPTARWQWTVLAGLRSADLGLPSGSVAPEALHAAAESWLRARGCLQGFHADYDRTVVYHPQVDLGPYAGQVLRSGFIAQRDLGSALTAHELAHTFGATDRYLDLGGSFQWAGALMAGVQGRVDASYTDAVLWGEVGLGDGDGDGVVDVRAAGQPDRLVAEHTDVTAFPHSNGLRVRVRLGLRQGDRRVVGLPQEATLSVPGTTARWEYVRWDVAARDDLLSEHYLFAPNDIPQSVFEEVVRTGSLALRVEARAHFTRDDFSRASVSLDATVQAPLVTQRGALEAPQRPRVQGGCGEH